jgi:predicted metal-dependent hydrolase
MHLFEWGENKIRYVLKRTSRRRSIGICVMPNSEVVLRVPKRLAKGEIDRILQKKADWIFSQQKNYQKFQDRFSAHRFVSGESLPYQGEKIYLEVERSISSKKSVLFENSKLSVYLPENQKHPFAAQREVLAWYRSEALKEINQSVGIFAPILRVDPKKITIRNQKHLWGSCTNRHHLSFNWRLILLPKLYLDYVVVHELCHIVHLNHSEKFWSLLKTILSESEMRRKWLKENSVEYLSFPRFTI